MGPRTAPPRRAPERLETPRLVLRRPRAADAEAIFARYAADPEVTRFLAWPRHATIAATREFLAWSDGEWERWPAGPLLVERRADGLLLGGSGLAFETPTVASTGYVLARDAWGLGYASETVRALVALAPRLGVERLYAVCHLDHAASARVLEKCAFAPEGIHRRAIAFPNLAPGEPLDVRVFARTFPALEP